MRRSPESPSEVLHINFIVDLDRYHLLILYVLNLFKKYKISVYIFENSVFDKMSHLHNIIYRLQFMVVVWWKKSKQLFSMLWLVVSLYIYIYIDDA